MKKNIKTMFGWKFILIFFSLFFCLQTFSFAADVTLGWDANEPDPDGYRLYYKTGSSGPPYNGIGALEGDSPITVELAELIDPDNPEYTINGLSDTETYFFVVTAYDSGGSESGYSNEVFYIPPTLVLSSLSISGDDSVSENSSASYIATATFSDGSTQIVTDSSDWSEDSAYSSINSSGVLTTSEISTDETVTIQASFTHGGVTQTATKVVTIVENFPPSTPIIVYPYDGEPECEVPLDIITESFSDPEDDFHSQSRWQISEQSNFSSLVLDATSNMHLTAVTVPHSVLKSDQTYYVRVQFYDAYFDASNWSDPVEFTTGFLFDDLEPNGIPDTWEVDDTVDFNLDGIPDNFQPDIIKCIRAVDGSAYIGVEKISDSISEIEALEVIDPATISDPANRPADLIFGLFSFRLRLNQPGATATVRVYFSAGTSLDDTFYKYDTINGWNDYSEHTTFNDDGQSVTLELQDGGYGDSDGVANGIIVDPGGIASWGTVAGGSIGDTGAGGGCFIATAAFGSKMERHVQILCEFRDQRLLKCKTGKKIVDFYYKTSPPIADYLRKHPIQRKAVRYALIPVTGLAYLTLHVHPVILLLGFSFMLMGLLYGVRSFLFHLKSGDRKNIYIDYRYLENTMAS